MERADAQSVYQLLEKLNIGYRKVEHPEAGSMEDLAEAEKQLGAVICKNLFLCNRQKTVFYLLLIPGGSSEMQVKDLQDSGKALCGVQTHWLLPPELRRARQTL